MEDIQELIRIANTIESRSNNKTRLNPTVLKYIRSKQIKQGPYRVPVYIIVHDYIKKWLGVKQQTKCGRFDIGRTFSKLFEKGRSGNFRYYYLNDVYDLSPEAKELAKRYYKVWQLTKRTKDLEQNTQH